MRSSCTSNRTPTPSRLCWVLQAAALSLLSCNHRAVAARTSLGCTQISELELSECWYVSGCGRDALCTVSAGREKTDLTRARTRTNAVWSCQALSPARGRAIRQFTVETRCAGTQQLIREAPADAGGGLFRIEGCGYRYECAEDDRASEPCTRLP